MTRVYFAHVVGEECWCKPRLYHVTETGNEVWVHNEPDGDAPPAAVLAEAIARAAANEED